jgi:Resolvase, N terminal domain
LTFSKVVSNADLGVVNRDGNFADVALRADPGTALCHSGVRPEGKRLFDMLRAGDTLVVRWVDRLGRNYTDVVDTLREFMRCGVIIKTVINGTTFDGSTTDPGSSEGDRRAPPTPDSRGLTRCGETPTRCRRGRRGTGDGLRGAIWRATR